MNKTADSLILSLILLVIMPAALWAKDIDATLQWSRKVDLSAPVSGVVTEVAANTGEYVRKGQALLRLDERYFKAKAEKARAEVKRLEVKLRESEQEFKRAKEMHERELLADHELELAKSGFLMSESEYKAAQANLTKAELDMEYSIVRAPFDAIILNRTVEVGQTIISTMQSIPVFTIADSGFMIARIRASEKELLGLSVGKKVSVKVSDKKYTGSISRIGMESVGSGNEGAIYEVDIKFAISPPAVMRHGQKAVVILP